MKKIIIGMSIFSVSALADDIMDYCERTAGETFSGMANCVFVETRKANGEQPVSDAGNPSPEVYEPFSDEITSKIAGQDSDMGGYCYEAMGGSYQLIERCIQLENEAQSRIQSMAFDPQVEAYCTSSMGGSYQLIERCIQLESESKSRLSP